MDTVVIVDNTSRWIDNYKRMLAPFQEAIPCMYFKHSEEAMEYMSSHSVAVLVSELDLPIMSGRELFEMVDMLSPDTVKIALTQVRDVAKTLDALNESKVFKLILKPFFLVEDLIVPIQEGITQYWFQIQEKEFNRKAEQKLEELNVKVEELWGKLAEKKQEYDRLCQAAAGLMRGNLGIHLSGLSQVEGEFVGEFCEKLLQEYVQFYMYEKQNFIFYMNYIKNQFHHPGKSCVFKIINQTGGDIPSLVMRRIAYGIYLIGCLCWQCLEGYHIENIIEREKDAYVLKVHQLFPDGTVSYKIKSPNALKLLLRMVQDLARVLSDNVEEQELGKDIAVKLYYMLEHSF